jgi:DNA replication protein DnaC
MLISGASQRLDVNELKKYTKPAILILDELGYLPIDKTGADLLFQVISLRYERGSLIITSNQPFAEWDRIFPDQMMTVAAVDRLVHHATIIEVSSDSYRRKEALGQVSVRTATATASTATTTAPVSGDQRGGAHPDTPSG